MNSANQATRAHRRALPRPIGPAAARRIEQLVEEFVGEVFGLAPGEVGASARFADDFGVDSFDLLELAVEAEERFGIEISDEALAEVTTVGDFARCVIDAMRPRERHFDPAAR